MKGARRGRGLIDQCHVMNDSGRMRGKWSQHQSGNIHKQSEIFHFPSLRSKRHQNKTYIEERL